MYKSMQFVGEGKNDLGELSSGLVGLINWVNGDLFHLSYEQKDEVIIC